MRLILEERDAKGIIMYRIEDSKLEIVQSKVVLFATGGYGRVFNTTSNEEAPTGDGLAMSAIAGISL